MWILTLRSPLGQPYEHVLRMGRTTIGRHPDSDIVISDESASRLHAEILASPDSNTLVIHDLESTNGTFVNRERLFQPCVLRPGDQIRIGQFVANLSVRDDRAAPGRTAVLSGTQSLTRDLLLESVDQHALTLYEAASRLNTIVDLDTALREVSQLLRVALGAENCGVILDERFDQLEALGVPTSIAQQAIAQHSIVVIPDLPAQTDRIVSQRARRLHIRAIMCVPVLAEKELVALLYAYRVDPTSQPFDERDVRLAVAISHQAGLTIQRARLLRQAREALQESEARYRAIVEDQTELICRFLPDGTLTFVNGAYCRYFGKTAEELVGTQFKPRTLPEEAHFVAHKRAALSPDRPTARYWHRVLLAGEVVRWQEWTDRALYDDRGRLIEVQSVGQDITERKQAEIALKQRNQELTALNEIATVIGQTTHLKHMVNTTLDKLSTMMTIDGSCVHLLDPGEGQSHSLALVAQRGFLPDVVERIEAIPLSDGPSPATAQVMQVVQHHLALAAGRQEAPAFIAVPLQAKDRVLGVLGVFRRRPGQPSFQDTQLLTALGHQVGVAIENVHLAQQAAEIELLRRLDRLRSELIANVSHELRTPLGLITVFCTTLLREDISVDPSMQREFLSDMKEEADKLARIVDNLLDLSRLQHGRLRLDKHPLDLGQMVTDTIAAMQLGLTRHRLVNRLASTPLVALADAKRIEQVQRNLLENAIKYSPAGGEITIGGRQVEDEVLIEISDQGIGIPPQELERIFESFYRVENESTQRVGGVGLGLAICREIIAAHGGRIWAESTPGVGSTFYFTLPIGRNSA